MSTTPGTGAPVTGLSHVQLLVTDIDTSADWYGRVLGLEPFVQDLDIGYVALRHPEARFVIVLTVGPGVAVRGQAGPAAPPDDSHRQSGPLDHLAFAVPDGAALSSWAVHLADIGIDHAGIVLENGNPSLQLRDPDGVAIELVAPGAVSAPGSAATTPSRTGAKQGKDPERPPSS